MHFDNGPEPAGRRPNPPLGPPPKMATTGHMQPECAIRDKLFWHKENLRLWNNGWLTLTEPDEEERRIAVAKLKAAIATLEWVLGEDK